MKVNPKVNIKLRTRKVFEVCLVLSLILHVAFFFAFREFQSEEVNLESVDHVFEMEDIPETEQIKRPPPPAAPAVPVESEDEDLMDDITIEDTELVNFTEFETPPPPPPPVEEEIPEFLPLEDQPQIIGGLAAIQKNVIYPDLAKKAGITGVVVIKVLISEKGVPLDFQVMKSLGSSGCDEAAIEGIKKARFKPAKQRGRAVKFWYTIPVRFTLTK